MRYLLDTNIVSEPSKKKPNPKVEQWLEAHEDESAVSILTLGEIERGILMLDESDRKQELQEWFDDVVFHLESEERLIGLDRQVVSCWARIYMEEEIAKKRKPDGIDTLLAATAERHSLTMVTRNVDHFPNDLPLINPWKP